MTDRVGASHLAYFKQGWPHAALTLLSPLPVIWIKGTMKQLLVWWEQKEWKQLHKEEHRINTVVRDGSEHSILFGNLLKKKKPELK